MWRTWITRASDPEEIIRGRMVAMAFQGSIGTASRFIVVSYYGTCSGLGARAQHMCRYGDWHSRQHLPVILGGDFNMPCAETAAWRPPESVLVCTSSEDPTCIMPDTVMVNLTVQQMALLPQDKPAKRSH